MSESSMSKTIREHNSSTIKSQAFQRPISSTPLSTACVPPIMTNNSVSRVSRVQKRAHLYVSPSSSYVRKLKRSSRFLKRKLRTYDWGDEFDTWKIMCNKDNDNFQKRLPHVYDLHHHINSSMRVLLVDWIMEVCEAYELTRNTFHLSVSLVDRYLNVNLNLPKSVFQMVGATALFIATKLEEIDVPPVTTFAYVSDGAFTAYDILQTELIMLHKLNWELTTITTYDWLYLYVQLAHYLTHYSKKNYIDFRPMTIESCFELQFNLQSYPKFSRITFFRAVELLDLVTLDDDSLLFPNHKVATCIIFYIFGRRRALYISGYKLKELEKCLKWMLPFYVALRKSNEGIWNYSKNEESYFSHTLPNMYDELPNTQLHMISTKVSKIRMKIEKKKLLELKSKKMNNINGNVDNLDVNYPVLST